MRTNIVIDDELIEEAMNLSGLGTKKAVIDAALHEFVLKHKRKDLAQLRGRLQFSDGYDYRRAREGR